VSRRPPRRCVSDGHETYPEGRSYHELLNAIIECSICLGNRRYHPRTKLFVDRANRHECLAACDFLKCVGNLYRNASLGMLRVFGVDNCLSTRAMDLSCCEALRWRLFDLSRLPSPQVTRTTSGRCHRTRCRAGGVAETALSMWSVDEPFKSENRHVHYQRVCCDTPIAHLLCSRRDEYSADLLNIIPVVYHRRLSVFMEPFQTSLSEESSVD